MPRIVYIDPDAAPGGDGSGRHPFASWSEFTLRNGDIALQRGGTVAAGFTIGPDAQSVTIGSYGTGRARIEGAAPYQAGTPDAGLDGDQMIALQQKLAKRGYEMGKADGVLGAATRAAVQAEQQRLGLPADGWPTPDLLDLL